MNTSWNGLRICSRKPLVTHQGTLGIFAVHVAEKDHPYRSRRLCKETTQKCERRVASDDHLYKSNEFGLLPINPIVRTLASQILTGIERSDRFSGTLLPLGLLLRWLVAAVPFGIRLHGGYYIATPVPMMLQVAASSLKKTDSTQGPYTRSCIFGASSLV